MKKPLLILAISASFIAGTMVAGNFVFADPADGQVNLLGQILSAIQSQEPVCPAENVQHWTTVNFQLQNNIKHPTFGIITQGPNHYKFLSNPAAEAKDVTKWIVDALNADGWEQIGNNPVETGDIAFPVIVNGYSICAEN